MAWSYTIDPDKKVIFTEGTGVLTEKDLSDGVQQAYRDPAFHFDLNALFDYTGVTEWKVSSEFMVSMATRQNFSTKTSVAILVRGSLSYGIARIYQTCAENGRVMIFNDRAEAVAWLNEGVPPESHIT